MDNLSEDDLTAIFCLLPFKDKVNCERVCRKWRIVAGRLVSGQKAIGNAPTNLSLIDHCPDGKHWITSLDTIPKNVLTNLSILPKILQKCPELKAIAITKPKEPTFFEANVLSNVATSKLASGEDIGLFNNNPFDNDGTDEMDTTTYYETIGQYDARMKEAIESHSCPGPSSSRDPDFHMLMMQKRVGCQKIFKKLGKIAVRKTEPRPTSLEDFMDAIGKYCKKLECIDIYGLRLNRGYRSDASDAGPWKSIIENCRSLVHIRTFQLNDKEFHSILANVSLTDVSAVYGTKGDQLDRVGPMFRKLCISSVKEYGLQKLLDASNLSNLRELSLAGVNSTTLNLIPVLNEKIGTNGLDTLNLSIGLNNFDVDHLSLVGKISNLKHLYIKRREENPIEKFDRPLNVIMSNCTHLVSIKLTNVIVSDSSIKNLQFNLMDLESISIELPDGKTNVTLSDRSLYSLAELKSLRNVFIDYPNTFTENTLIDYLFRAHSLSNLYIHGCKELIPINQIGLAAVRQATRQERLNRFLTVDIDTREKMEIGPNIKHLMRYCPKNLHYTISTALDMFSSKYPDGRPIIVLSDQDEDFDEHRAFFFEAAE